MSFKRLAIAFLAASLPGVPARAAGPSATCEIRTGAVGFSRSPIQWRTDQRSRLLGAHRSRNSRQTDSPGDNLSPEEKQDLDKKALVLLGELVDEGMALRLVGNRIHILSFAAEMLWKRDETRARGYLREAVTQFLGMGPLPSSPNARANQGIQTRQALRAQLIQTISDLDPRMALDFLRSSRPPTSAEQQVPDGRPSWRPFWQEDYERQFETQLAIRIAENDPQLALQLAEETLKRDVDHQVVEIWRRLQAKDPKAAVRLAAEIVAKIKSADAITDYRMASVINEMVFDLRERIRDQQNPKKDSPPSGLSEVSIRELEQIYRELLDVVVAAALKITPANLMDINEQGPARNVLSQAQSLYPDIDKYVPARAAALRARLGQFEKAYYHPPAPVESFEALEQKSSAELMAMAEKSKGEVKDMLYSQALGKALEAGDIEAAKQISNGHLKGSNEFLSQEIEGLEREKAMKEGKLDEARKTLDRLPSDAERAMAIVRMAETVKDPKTQKELLAEAKGALGDRMDTRTEVESQLALAIAYLKFDSEYSFNLLDAAIGKLDSMVSASVMLMKFTQELHSDEEEMRLGQGAQGGMSHWITAGFDDRIFAFARKDFARTQAAIAKWQHSQTRLAMNMTLIARILGEEKAERQSRPFYGESLPFRPAGRDRE